MKRLMLRICVLAVVLALTGVVSASPPEEKTFWLTGYTTDYDYETLPSGHTLFHLTAQGGGESAEDETLCQAYGMPSCHALCLLTGRPCGVDGDFTGTFTFDEWGISRTDGSGNNRKLITIASGDDDMVIEAGGRNQITGYDPNGLPVGIVEGTFTVVDAYGDTYAGLHGRGTYSGPLGVVFSVEYTGRFHTHP